MSDKRTAACSGGAIAARFAHLGGFVRAAALEKHARLFDGKDVFVWWVGGIEGGEGLLRDTQNDDTEAQHAGWQFPVAAPGVRPLVPTGPSAGQGTRCRLVRPSPLSKGPVISYSD